MQKNLRQALVERGLRSNWIADQLGLTEACFSRLANGRSPADRLEPEHIRLLADILRLDEPEVRELLR